MKKSIHLKKEFIHKGFCCLHFFHRKNIRDNEKKELKIQGQHERNMITFSGLMPSTLESPMTMVPADPANFNLLSH